MTEHFQELFDDHRGAEATASSDDAAGKAYAEHVLSGEVMRVVFQSDDGQYTVIRLLDTDGKERTLVGPLGDVLEGQQIEARGRWEKHREYGWQFRVERFRAILPKSAIGIQRYLASGLIPGIGPELARRMVEVFGEETLNVLDNAPDRLRQVDGVGRKRIDQIKESWEKHAQQREVYIFLQSLGIGPAQAQRLIQTYGWGVAEVVRSNPYRLASDIHGIGFKTADRIAGELGITSTDPTRLCAGACYVLQQLTEEGHVSYPRTLLIDEIADTLGVNSDYAAQGLERAQTDGRIVAEKPAAGTVETLLYPHSLYAAECGLANALKVLIHQPCERLQVDTESGAGLNAILNDKQKLALSHAFDAPISILTGGPGVGKTTVVARIVECARAFGLKALLAAPTGRAAKRLSETCGKEAKTIHRLLKWDPGQKSFVYNKSRPLPCDMLILDEVSMLDVNLACQLFQAIREGTRLVLVGDRDQLPSVGPGRVLNDMINAGVVPVTHLTEIYRQEGHSRIVQNAHAVNQGRMPNTRQDKEGNGRTSDFYWIEQGEPANVLDVVLRLVSERIPARFGFNPMSDVQIIAPMNRGQCGTIHLNNELQHRLNPLPQDHSTENVQVQFGERLFRKNDRVMQVTNNYDKGVFNGELGLIAAVDHENRSFHVMYDTGVVDYGFHEADQITLAYAVTVHKSQGSEFPVVIMPVLTQHYIMLQRNLIYTGMTRARRLLVMVGTHKALAVAVRNAKPIQRYTLLTERLRGEV